MLLLLLLALTATDFSLIREKGEMKPNYMLASERAGFEVLCSPVSTVNIVVIDVQGVPVAVAASVE